MSGLVMANPPHHSSGVMSTCQRHEEHNHCARQRQVADDKRGHGETSAALRTIADLIEGNMSQDDPGNRHQKDSRKARMALVFHVSG